MRWSAISPALRGILLCMQYFSPMLAALVILRQWRGGSLTHFDFGRHRRSLFIGSSFLCRWPSFLRDCLNLLLASTLSWVRQSKNGHRGGFISALVGQYFPARYHFRRGVSMTERSLGFCERGYFQCFARLILSALLVRHRFWVLSCRPRVESIMMMTTIG